jgi:hypothetical protein
LQKVMKVWATQTLVKFGCIIPCVLANFVMYALWGCNNVLLWWPIKIYIMACRVAQEKGEN